jgi:hypothetical protein
MKNYNSLLFRYRSKQSEKQKFLIFFSDRGREILIKAKNHHFDCTFKSCPKPYKQILTINACYQGNFFVCAFILLTEKTKEAYYASLCKIKELIEANGTSMKIDVAFCDFENALQQAIPMVFGELVLKGCWFHFNQAIMKRHNTLGFRGIYRSSFEFNCWIRHFRA